MIAVPQPLRKVFDESDLVIAAVAGPTRVLERKDNDLVVATELQIEMRVKGKVSGRSVTYRHTEYGSSREEEAGRRDGHLEPGTKVLAFLDHGGEATAAGQPTFESADYSFGVKTLSADTRAAYLERLDALARLERAGPSGGARWSPASSWSG